MTRGISVLLPTRKRLGGLVRTVNVLRELAGRPDDLEFLVRVDDDDPTDYGDFLATTPGVVFLRGPRWGYKNMHMYYGQLAAAASHPWCQIWNDDMFMITNYWDQVLLARNPEKLHVQFLKRDTYGPEVPGDPYKNTDTACPAFPKKLFELMGRVSDNAHVDSWLDYVSEALGIKTFRHDIVYHHDRLEDETAHECIAGWDWEAFQNEKNTSSRTDDINKIRAFFDAHPEMRPCP